MLSFLSCFLTSVIIKDGMNTNSQEFAFPMPLYDPIQQNSKKFMAFKRALNDKDAACASSGLPHLEKISMCTSYLDLSPIYGNSIQQNNKLRSFWGGELLTSWVSGKESLPVNKKLKTYLAFDKRNLIAPSITALHILFVREHNRIAKNLQLVNPAFNDEYIFQEARKINIAQYQHITYYEWLPLHLNETYMIEKGIISTETNSYYVNNYDTYMDASAISAFSVVAFRYGHHQVPGYFT